VSRVLAAHQPNYLPWLGLFHKLSLADVWVIADDVQYTTHGLVNRNRIRTATGWQWLTVPVLTRGRGRPQIREVMTAGASNWQRKHWEAIRWNYRHGHGFEEIGVFLERFYCHSEWQQLVDANIEMGRFLLAQLGTEVEVYRSSDLELRQERTERLVEMVAACGCDVYLAGDGASRDYLDAASFEEAGIELRFAEFSHPVYEQCFPGFEANMSALDLLLSCGSERAREVTRFGRT
jgi:hypothetical protein